MYHKRSPAKKAGAPGNLGNLGAHDSEADGDGSESIQSKIPEHTQPAAEKQGRPNLVDQYLALLIVILATAGLFDVSTHSISSYDYVLVGWANG